MTFPELTRIMLNSMDFFELRRTAARYTVAYQGVRRQKLIRDLERKILSKSVPQASAELPKAMADRYPEGATSAKPNQAESKAFKPVGTRINTFSTRSPLAR